MIKPEEQIPAEDQMHRKQIPAGEETPLGRGMTEVLVRNGNQIAGEQFQPWRSFSGLQNQAGKA